MRSKDWQYLMIKVERFLGYLKAKKDAKKRKNLIKIIINISNYFSISFCSLACIFSHNLKKSFKVKINNTQKLDQILIQSLNMIEKIKKKIDEAAFK